ncbi:MAG: hypothetical protein JOZ75_09930 [Candidatus Dormibacteraeota bacterium]|nr:hypothetical protein [Candidatus Dormibacteraeota bacterium]
MQPISEQTSRYRARFEAAVAAGATDGGREEDRDVMRALAEAPITRAGDVMYGSNAVFLLEFDAPDPQKADERLRAVYKPVRGERPLWDFPRNTLFLREVATYLVDAAIGLGRVPPTVLRSGPLGPGSVQLFVHHAAVGRDETSAATLEQQLREVAALDALVNNADRKRAHLLVTDGPNVRAIDNALTFLPYPRQRTALIALGGTPLPDDTAERVRTLAGDAGRAAALVERLSRLLAPAEVEAFSARLRELADDPVYPELDDWDGRPFEWW